MRAVQTDTYETFLHTHRCVIDSNSRASCKKCRFAKCLEVGMKVSYVKVHQEQCHKLSNEQNAGVVIQKRTPLLSLDFLQERSTLEDLYEHYFATSGHIYYECFAKNPSAFLEQICQSTQYRQSAEEFMAFMDYMDVQAFSTFAFNMTSKDGVIEDAQMLYRHNYARLKTFCHISCFVGNLEEFLKYGRNNRQRSWDVEQLMQLHDLHGKKNAKIEYDTFYPSPWASTFDIEYEHKNICQAIINWYMKVGHLPKCLFLLIQLILLYNSDGIEEQLKHATKIKDLQAYYSKVLHRYLKSYHNPAVANILLGKGLMLVHDTQRAYDLSKYRLKLV